MSVVSDSVYGGDWKSQVKMTIEEVEERIQELEIDDSDDEDEEEDVVVEKKQKGKKGQYDDSSDDDDDEEDNHEDHGHNPDYIE